MPFYLEKSQGPVVRIDLYDPEKLGQVKAMNVRIESLSKVIRNYVIITLSYYEHKIIGQLNELDFEKLACDTGSILILKKIPRDL